MLRPSFLICSERSGSNLLRSILDAHPQIYAPQPLHLAAFWERAHEFGGAWDALLEAIVEFLGGWKGSLGPGLELGLDELRAAAPERSFAALYEHIYARGLAASGKRELFIKENHTAQRAPLLLAAYPEASFVYQVRDPRDFLASCKRMPAYKYGSAEAALAVWIADQCAALELQARLPNGRVHAVRYEALLADPQGVLEPLCARFGVAYDARMLEFYKRADAQRSASDPAWCNLARPLLRDNAGHYAQVLTPAEIARVEAEAGALMGELGYPRPPGSTHARAEPDASIAPDADPQPPHLRCAAAGTGSARVQQVIDRHLARLRAQSESR